MIEVYHVFGDRWTLAGSKREWYVIKGKQELNPWIARPANIMLFVDCCEGPWSNKAHAMRWIRNGEIREAQREREEMRIRQLLHIVGLFPEVFITEQFVV